MALVANSWLVRIRRRDGKPDEEQYCADEQEARELLRLLNDPDNADMYRNIALIKVDWRGQSEHIIDTIEFEEENA